MKYSLFAALAAAALGAACTHPIDNSGAPSFGEATEANRDRQMTPVVVEAAPPEGSGSQGVLAQSRYRAGTTKPLLPSSSSIANPSTTN
ncbi:hypothetical protein [Terricaulis silvestris]|uniref:Lipoprotein n=1 Tax=Terricaulis silvestris TaxID=2686094 RepID=A0A6I6MQZ3_9CAUL|nr:hypothetical protein [Terricaulis silvestris]QGZ96591.1 hypothetical protein DSM104635_03451 [Terricaulis silvestris]